MHSGDGGFWGNTGLSAGILYNIASCNAGGGGGSSGGGSSGSGGDSGWDDWTTLAGRRIDPKHIYDIFYEREFSDWELDLIIDHSDHFLTQADGAGIHLMRNNQTGLYDVVITATGDESFIVTAYRDLKQKKLDEYIASGWWR